MITEILLDILSEILHLFLSLLPNAEPLPSNISSAFVSFASYWNIAESFFPVSTVFQILVLLLTIEAGILVFKLINFSINKLRGSG